MIIVVDSNGVVYEAENLVPGAGEVFTDDDGLLDLSAYSTTDYGDGVTLWGGLL